MRNISESSIRNPMAVAAVSGLIASTALTLVVIPVVFTCFDDLQTVSRIFQRKLRNSDAIPAQE
jgi:Cu/Ag efflux pump CusA